MTANMIPKARIPLTMPPIRAFLFPLLADDVLSFESGPQDADSVCSDGETVDVIGVKEELGFVVGYVPALLLLFPVVAVTSERDG